MHCFTALRCASATLAMALCLSVCPSVCVCLVSVTSRYSPRSIETSKRIKLVFGVKASFHRPDTILWRNSGIFKNKGTSLWNFVPNSDSENFAGQSIVLATKFVDGRACWPQSRRSTRRGWMHIVYYMSVDRNALTPLGLLRFVLDLLYDLLLQFFSHWRNFD